jgi:glucokinase
MTAGTRVGFDVGATAIKAGLVDGGGVILARASAPAPSQGSEQDLVDLLASLASGLTPDPAVPVGAAVAGVIDGGAQVIRESPNYPSWKDFHLSRRLSEATGRRVVIDNDANLATLGEAAAGVGMEVARATGRSLSHAIGLTLGTGVGGGLLLDGRLYRGERGMAGELGHLTVIPDGRPCACGNRGCLERYAGALGLAESMRETPAQAADWYAEASDPRTAARHLAGRASRGEAAAEAILADMGRLLGQAIAGLVHAFDVRTFLLMGGVAGAAPHFMPALERELTARTFRSMREGVRVLTGVLGHDAALVGASVLAQEGAGG